MKPTKDERGFTLIESLLVLSIFMTILTVSLNLCFHAREDFTSKLFLKQLTEDLFYSQQYAMSHALTVFLLFDPQGGAYRAYTPSGTVYKRGIPPDMEVLPGSMGLKFHFVPSGNINKAGALYVKLKKKRIN
ncbi:competence type IV pilus minor pilin ComGD [Peribacillus kribbensis]|uniref:competence type IV pilus minor pilin ComGD n=1 Tax=Peribacillus kribbensis TaxID=356658 RepID=UPI000410E47D|nr:competence type IV pilus minor pilin ComGD [Peribacillus kribbensis]